MASIAVSTPTHAITNNNLNPIIDLRTLKSIEPKQTPKKESEPIRRAEPKPDPAPIPIVPPEPRKYVVQDGDTLSSIAENNTTTWPRLWNRNADLSDPNILHTGQVLIIPLETEVIADRVVPGIAPSASPDVAQRAVVPGNAYAPGYCTWYVKNRRADLPNYLGDANAWQSSAAAQGLPTGSAPRAGAVGTTGAGPLGHVVYVERVNGDGTVFISEMNYAGGLFVVHTRTVAASEFSYIY